VYLARGRGDEPLAIADYRNRLRVAGARSGRADEQWGTRRGPSISTM